MIVPARQRTVDVDLHARLIDAAKNIGTVDLHPKRIAPDLDLEEFENHVGIGAEIQFDLVADGDVLDRLGDEEAQTPTAVVAKETNYAVGQRRGAQFRVLIVLQQIHPHQLRPVFRLAVAVLNLEGNFRCLPSFAVASTSRWGSSPCLRWCR